MSVWEERAEAKEQLRQAQELLDRACEAPHILNRTPVHAHYLALKRTDLFAQIRTEVERSLPAKILDGKEKNLSSRLQDIRQAIRARRKRLKRNFKDVPSITELERCFLISICQRLRDDREERLKWAMNDYTNGGLWPPFRSNHFPLDEYAEHFYATFDVHVLKDGLLEIVERKDLSGR